MDEKILVCIVIFFSFSLVYYTFNERNIDEANKLYSLSHTAEKSFDTKKYNIFFSFKNTDFKMIYRKIAEFAKKMI